MLNVFFDGGNFVKTVTDVNVHERLGLANEVRNQVLSKDDLTAIVHPHENKASGRIAACETISSTLSGMIAEK